MRQTSWRNGSGAAAGRSRSRSGGRRGAVLLALALCGLLVAVQGAAGTKRLEMPHYSVNKPAERGWRVKRLEKQHETTILTRRISPFVFQIRLAVNPILDEGLHEATAAEIADDFRRREETTMREQGVARGLYELHNLTHGERSVGGKTFYTMDYDIESRTGLQRASLQLCFPHEAGNRWFLLAHYSETIPVGAVLLKSHRGAFEEVLESLQLAAPAEGGR